MTVKNKIFRHVTLGLQIIAILAYFIPPLFIGGSVGLFWLIVGVIHTAMFCAMFFRDARRRTALSIIFMILVILWCLFLLILGTLFLSSYMHVTIVSPIIVYSLSALLAAIFALAAPRRFETPPQEAV